MPTLVRVDAIHDHATRAAATIRQIRVLWIEAVRRRPPSAAAAAAAAGSAARGGSPTALGRWNKPREALALLGQPAVAALKKKNTPTAAAAVRLRLLSA